VTKEEINKIIAEFMGWVKPEGFYQHYEIPKDFILKDPIEIPSQFGRGTPTESLDSLIPVVEKLKIDMFEFDFQNDEWWAWVEVIDGQKLDNFIAGNHKSPSMALATACAKVIKEL